MPTTTPSGAPSLTAYVGITNTNAQTVNGWPKDQTRYYAHDKALSCAQAVAAFSALTLSQMLSATTLAVPVPPGGSAWQIRSCGGQPPPTGGDLITDVRPDTDAGGDGYDDGSGTTPGPGAGTSPGGRVTATGRATYQGGQVSYLTVETP